MKKVLSPFGKDIRMRRVHTYFPSDHHCALLSINVAKCTIGDISIIQRSSVTDEVNRQ